MNSLLAGGEPFYFPGNRTGCLLVHGFTASPQEMHGLGQHLAQRGYTVLGVRLFGHAVDIHDMLRARWTDWYSSVEDGYHLLHAACARIVVMGLSLGGVLSLILAASYPLAGAVVMSTPFAPPQDLRVRLFPILARLAKFYPKGPPDWRDPEAQTTRVAYNAYPLAAFGETFQAMGAMRACLDRVSAPTLLMHSKEDTFVVPENMHRIHEHLGSQHKETLLVENSNHVITLDLARPLVYRAAADFVARTAEGGAR